MDLPSLTREVVAQGMNQTPGDDESLHSLVVDRVEKELILQVLQNCGGVQTKAATRLGINRNTLHKKIKEYGLDNIAAPTETSRGTREPISLLMIHDTMRAQSNGPSTF